MRLATWWRTRVGMAIVLLLIVAALILAVLLSGAENGEGMPRSSSSPMITTSSRTR
jgi:hypothetical protein